MSSLNKLTGKQLNPLIAGNGIGVDANGNYFVYTGEGLEIIDDQLKVTDDILLLANNTSNGSLDNGRIQANFGLAGSTLLDSTLDSNGILTISTNKTIGVSIKNDSPMDLDKWGNIKYSKITPTNTDIICDIFGGSNTLFVDSSPDENTIVPHGNVALYPYTYKFGTSSGYIPNTVGDYLSITNYSNFNFMHQGTPQWTVETYCKIPSYGGVAKMIFDTAGSTSANNGVTIFIYTSGQIGAGIFRGVPGQPVIDYLSTAGDFPNDGNMHHLLISYDHSLESNNLKIFVDGVLIRQATKTANAPSANSCIHAYIGTHDASTTVFNGNLDELRISNNVRQTSTFNLETSPYTSDANTKLLLHMDYSLYRNDIDSLTDLSDIDISSYTNLFTRYTLTRNSINDSTPTIFNSSITWEGIGSGIFNIYNNTLTQNVTSIDIPIPKGYYELDISMFLQSSTGSGESLQIQFNGVTSSVYDIARYAMKTNVGADQNSNWMYTTTSILLDGDGAYGMPLCVSNKGLLKMTISNFVGDSKSYLCRYTNNEGKQRMILVEGVVSISDEIYTIKLTGSIKSGSKIVIRGIR